MPTAWYIVPYKLKRDPDPIRYCAMDDHSLVIFGEGGNWTESEVLGDRAIVKVGASVATLGQINDVPGFIRLPKDRLNDPLSSLTTNQRTALRNLLTDMGYSLAEIQARLGNDLGQKTLGDVLRFMATRRRKPRYDSQTDTVVFDGPVQACRSIDDVDQRIT